MVFFNLRQSTDSVQALLTVTPEKVSKQMVKWAAGLADESIVLVEGTAQKTHEPIKSASVSDVEIHVDKVRDLNFCERFFLLIRGFTDSPNFWLGVSPTLHRRRCQSTRN
jgi:aspartyl/asparaginyl-tRNA synthetase